MQLNEDEKLEKIEGQPKNVFVIDFGLCQKYQDEEGRNKKIVHLNRIKGCPLYLSANAMEFNS